VGLAATMLGFENLGRGVLSGGSIAALLVGGLVLLGLFLRHARAVAAPILDLSLLRLPSFRAAVAGGFAFRAGIGALPFLLPLLLQRGFGWTPFASGMTTCSAAAGALLMKLSAAPILRLFGFRQVLIVNTFLCSFFMAVCALFRPTTAHGAIVAALLVGGFFRSLQFTSLNTLAYAEVTAPAMSRATTLASVGQQLSLTFGVGLGALILHATLALGRHARRGGLLARLPRHHAGEPALPRLHPAAAARRRRRALRLGARGGRAGDPPRRVRRSRAAAGRAPGTRLRRLRAARLAALAQPGGEPWPSTPRSSAMV
jgi:hypothetical protein